MKCENVKAHVAKIGTSSGFAGTGGLCLKLVIDIPMDDDTSDLYRLVMGKVHEARELFVTDMHHDSNEESDQRNAKLQVPTARLGVGTHTMRLFGLPPAARGGDAAPILEIKSAELGKHLKFECVGQDHRMRLEVIARMALIGSAVDCATLDMLHKSDVWLSLEPHQTDLPGIGEAGDDDQQQPRLLDVGAGVSKRSKPAEPEPAADPVINAEMIRALDDAALTALLDVMGADDLRRQYTALTQKATRSNDTKRLQRMIRDAITEGE